MMLHKELTKRYVMNMFIFKECNVAGLTTPKVLAISSS